MREIDAAALEYFAFLNQARYTATAIQGRSSLVTLSHLGGGRGGGPFPGIGSKGQTVCSLKRGDNTRLQVEQIGFDSGSVECGGSHQGRRMAPVARSIRVEGRRRWPICPSMTRTRVPNIWRHSAAVLTGILPLLLALVETSAMPSVRHNRAAPGWAVTRMAMVGRPPVRRGEQAEDAGTTQVTGPGQVRFICASLAALSGRIKGWSRLKQSAISNRPLAALRPLSRMSCCNARGLRGSHPRP